MVTQAQVNLNFFAERIDFELSTSRFSTNGVYYFANHSDKKISQPIYFPFAENADSVEVEMVYDLSNNRTIEHQFSEKGIYFEFWAAPNDTTLISIMFTQKTTCENIYILKSTQSWGKPLKSAKYSLIVDKLVKVDSFSFIPDKVENNIYYWDKQDFSPKMDFKIYIGASKK